MIMSGGQGPDEKGGRGGGDGRVAREKGADAERLLVERDASGVRRAAGRAVATARDRGLLIAVPVPLLVLVAGYLR